MNDHGFLVPSAGVANGQHEQSMKHVNRNRSSWKRSVGGDVIRTQAVRTVTRCQNDECVEHWFLTRCLCTPGGAKRDKRGREKVFHDLRKFNVKLPKPLNMLRGRSF